MRQQMQQFGKPLEFARLIDAQHLQRCHSSSSWLLYAKGPGVPLPAETIRSLAHRSDLPVVSCTPGSKISMEVHEKALDLSKPSQTFKWLTFSVEVRTLKFALLFASVALGSMLAFALDLHLLFLPYAAGMAILCYRFDLLRFPWAPSMLSLIGIPVGLALPWSLVPAYLLLNFNSFTKDLFTGNAMISCSDGLSWEFHLTTALLAASSASLWAKVLEAQVKQVEQTPLGAVPDFLRSFFHFFPKVSDFVAKPPPWAKKLQILMGWVHKSIGDQYLDFCSFLVMRACGYKFAWLAFALVCSAVALQNIGGAIVILCTVPGNAFTRLKYASICLVMAPPWELVDPNNLEEAGMFLTATRAIAEDLPQLILKFHFTWTVHVTLFVIFDLCVSLPFALLDGMVVFKYMCKRANKTKQTYLELESGDIAT